MLLKETTRGSPDAGRARDPRPRDGGGEVMARPTNLDCPTPAELRILQAANGGNGFVSISEADIEAVRSLEAAELGRLIDDVFWINSAGVTVARSAPSV